VKKIFKWNEFYKYFNFINLLFFSYK
jgi:hypothetical protein